MTTRRMARVLETRLSREEFLELRLMLESEAGSDLIAEVAGRAEGMEPSLTCLAAMDSRCD